MCECFLPLTFVKLLPDAFEWVLSLESLNSSEWHMTTCEYTRNTFLPDNKRGKEWAEGKKWKSFEDEVASFLGGGMIF